MRCVSLELTDAIMRARARAGGHIYYIHILHVQNAEHTGHTSALDAHGLPPAHPIDAAQVTDATSRTTE